MVRSLVAALSALFLMLSAGAAAAQTVGTTSDPGSGINVADGQIIVGQRIVAPSAGLQLQSYRLSIARDTATFSVTPVVYEVTSGGATGNGPLTVSLLWTGSPTSIPNTGAPVDYTFTLPTTLALDPAKVYAVAVRQSNAGEQGGVSYATTASYAPGQGLYRDSGFVFQGFAADLGFQATFAPVIVPVPTLSEWAMIGLGLLLAAGAALMIQRRRLA